MAASARQPPRPGSIRRAVRGSGGAGSSVRAVTTEVAERGDLWSTSRPTYRAPLLDAFRGLLVTWVVLSHLIQWVAATRGADAMPGARQMEYGLERLFMGTG